MLKISHEKNEFLYGTKCVVFFEPFVSLVYKDGFVLEEIQCIEYQKALDIKPVLQLILKPGYKFTQ